MTNYDQIEPKFYSVPFGVFVPWWFKSSIAPIYTAFMMHPAK